MTAMLPPPSVWWGWPARPASVTTARHHVMDYLRKHATLDPPLNDVGLVTSELVTNAVQHAYVDRVGGDVRVGLDFTARYLRLSVEDDGRGLTPRTDSPGLGLGLPIMAIVAEDVTTSTSPGAGTRVTVSFLRDSRRP